MSLWKPTYWRFITGLISFACVSLVLLSAIATSSLSARKANTPNIPGEMTGGENTAGLESPKKTIKPRLKKSDPLKESDAMMRDNFNKPLSSVVRQSEQFFLDRATHRVSPIYPPFAKQARISGDVVIEITVNDQGEVVGARCIKGPALLQQAALDAAKKWRFSVTENDLEAGEKLVGVMSFRFIL